MKRHRYFKWWLLSLSLVFELNPLKCIRLIVLNVGIIIRIGDKNYAAYIGLPKYCLMLTNEKGYPITADHYFFKLWQFHILHTVGVKVTEIDRQTERAA